MDAPRTATRTGRFLRTKEAALYCGRSTSDLEKRRVRGDGPPYRKIGRIVVYDVVDLEAWVVQHALCRSTSEVPRNDGSSVGDRAQERRP